ncbi:hypothetical protein IU468_12890 [Nocardia farcinica]|uniref:hypothetical protein n=1 Tax=Nocardia farcinica TaxID=37329 RepID=UPI001892DAA9|nr:hypothetical protein [Nocardia farcinica]MBF6257217.1 hypothetical protein [Nocardia farcinica]
MRDENEVIDEEFVAPPLAVPIEQFLTDLANANRPANTVRAYRADLTGCQVSKSPSVMFEVLFSEIWRGSVRVRSGC